MTKLLNEPVLLKMVGVFQVYGLEIYRNMIMTIAGQTLLLCRILAFWCQRDFQQIDRLFRQSGLMRPKWDELHGKETYGNMTIQEAVKHCETVYTGNSKI